MAKMSSDLATAIKECQRELQPMFAKPKLKSRLLTKPPFRYIHDIIIAIIDTTNFPASAYFTGDELDSNTFKEKKNEKLAFLDKLIVLVNSYGNSVQVDARKIVAGLEPASTLQLLVEFGRLSKKGVDAESLSRLPTTGVDKDVVVVEEEIKDDDVMKEETKDDAVFAVEIAASKDGFLEEEKDEENSFEEEKDSDDVNVEEAKDNDDNIDTDGNHSKSLFDSLQNIITSASIIEQIYTE